MPYCRTIILLRRYGNTGLGGSGIFVQNLQCKLQNVFSNIFSILWQQLIKNFVISRPMVPGSGFVIFGQFL